MNTLDTLNQLLKTALRHELNRKRGEGTVKKLQKIRMQITDSYSNPQNWFSTGVILMVRRDGEKEEVVGQFEEFLHKKSSARKMIAYHGPLVISRIEYCSGLIGKVVPPRALPLFDLAAQREIRDYLVRIAKKEKEERQECYRKAALLNLDPIKLLRELRGY